MTEQQKKVIDFHRAIDSSYIGEYPRFHDKENCARLVMEETVEFVAACGLDPEELVKEFKQKVTIEPNFVDAIDALVDIEYVVNGAYVAFGVDSEPIFNEVHRSNMQKIGPNGEVLRGPTGKVLKPAGWTPPNIWRELAIQEDLAGNRKL